MDKIKFIIERDDKSLISGEGLINEMEIENFYEPTSIVDRSGAKGATTMLVDAGKPQMNMNIHLIPIDIDGKRVLLSVNTEIQAVKEELEHLREVNAMLEQALIEYEEAIG